jgi:hypothetical protein
VMLHTGRMPLMAIGGAHAHMEKPTFSAEWLLRLVSGCARKFFLRRYFACIQTGR